MQPVVVSPRDDAGPIGILDQAQGKPGGRVENRGVDLRSFDELYPGIGPGAVHFVQTAHETARPAVEGRKDGKNAGSSMSLVRAVEVLLQLRVGFQDMA